MCQICPIISGLYVQLYSMGIYLMLLWVSQKIRVSTSCNCILCVLQHFELDLSEEVLAQTKYYQEQGEGSEVWSEILHPAASTGLQSQGMAQDLVDSPDNISLQSCPVGPPRPDNNMSPSPIFTPHHKRTKSACLPVRPPRSHRP